MGKVQVFSGDSLELMKKMEDCSVDSLVSDPPYGLSKEPEITEVLEKWMAGEDYIHNSAGFMGKDWDSFVPGPNFWKEVYRVMKPGAYGLVFAGTRTQDLMTISLRMAGFEVRDVIEWIYFSGFPKSLNVSKAFDKRAGVKGEFLGYDNNAKGRKKNLGKFAGSEGSYGDDSEERKIKLVSPASDLAKKWEGYGTGLKPGHEPIILIRKKLEEKTVVENVEKHGVGVINIEGCRIKTEEDLNGGCYGNSNRKGEFFRGLDVTEKEFVQPEGRFPANMVSVESDQFYSKYVNVSSSELSKKCSKKDRNTDWEGKEIDLEEKPVYKGKNNGKTLDCKECGRVENGNFNSCVEKGHEVSFVESNTKSKNTHPTVKPRDLMSWLVKLVTPVGGVVFDPFLGSGTTAMVAKKGEFGFIGAEMEKDYKKIIEARVGEKMILVGDYKKETGEKEDEEKVEKKVEKKVSYKKDYNEEMEAILSGFEF